MGNNEFILSINDLHKSYNGTDFALKNFNINIEPGDIYGFIGSNGAGKTTALKCIAGLQSFDKGEVKIDDISLISQPVLCKSKFAYIPDNPDLFEYLTGIQYLNFICDIFEINVEDRRKRIKKESEDFGINEVLGDMISSYSHGMKQKLAIVSALVHEPKLWILDEPFVGLDPEASLMLKNKMRKRCENGGAIFFSTHVLEVAEKLCNKVVIIRRGEIIAQGNMDDILADKSLEDKFMEVIGHVKAD